MEHKNMLAVGDVVFRQDRGRQLTHRVKIERVTKTLAISGNFRFRITYGASGWVDEMNKSRWDFNSWYKSTAELEQKWARQIKLNHVKDFDYHKLDNDKLDAIIAVLKQNENGNKQE